jgi:hypothetical protein
MEQIIGAGFPRYVIPDLMYLQREVGTVPGIAFPEIEIEIVYFLVKSGLDLRVLHEKAVEKGSTAFLCSDNEEIG